MRSCVFIKINLNKMEANKFIEKKFFNRHFFLEAINESNHPIDFIADLMEEWEQLRIHDVVGRSEQLVAFLEFVVDYKMLEVDLEYEEIAKRFLGN